MDQFLANSNQASSLSELWFSELECAWSLAADMEEAKEQLYRLIDAYGIVDQAAHRGIYQQAILQAIVLFLGYALRRFRKEKEERRDSGIRDPMKWQLNLGDILLLTMFFSDLTTITEPVLYRSLTQALGLLCQLGTPLVYLPNLSATAEEAHGDEEKVLQQPIRSELSALRVMLSKRLAMPVAFGGGSYPSVLTHQWTLDALMQIFRTVWESCQAFLQRKGGILKVDYDSDFDRITCELTELCSGLLLPVRTALEGQIQHMNAPTGANDRTPHSRDSAMGAANSTACISLLIASALHSMEHVLWECDSSYAEVLPVSPSAPRDQRMDLVFQHVTTELIGLLHKYLTLRQHLVAGGGPGHSYGTERDAAGADRCRGTDVFLFTNVQHALQRALSVALEIDHNRQILKPQERSMLVAALNSFGGPVKSYAGFHGPSAEANLEGNAREAAEWAEAGANRVDCRVRRCMAIIAVRGSGGMAACSDDGGDAATLGLDALAEEEGAELGMKGALLLKSSLGPVTASALVDMVMLSLSALDLLTEDDIRAHHLQGLQVMQYESAKRAQTEELERLQQLEQQGVDAIPAGKLLEHVHDSASLHARGMQTLRRATARAKLQREAFSSILSCYRFMKGESESTVRNAQALIARTLVKMPAALIDVTFDELSHQLHKEFLQEQKVKHELSNNSNNGASGSNSSAIRSLVSQPSSYYQLTLQALFMYFAAQAPVRSRGASAVATAALLLEEDGGLSMRGNSDAVTAGVVGAVLSSHRSPIIDTENPIAFIQGSGPGNSGMTAGKKRAREDARGDAKDNGRMNTFVVEEEDTFCFMNDTRSVPCAYSHALCRMMELAESCQLNALLLDLLLQAPALTRYVWNYIYKQFCLSSDKVRCIIGFWLLKNLAMRREVHRSCALNLLLHLCFSTREYARRLAIREIGVLLVTTRGPHGKPVIPQEAEALLVQHAKRQLAPIASYQHPAPTRAEAAGGVDDEKGAEEARAQEMFGRHLGLFLKLCLRQPRLLFVSLLDVYKQCVERGNKVMMRLLPLNTDVLRMTQLLFKSDPASFMNTVVPYLRRYSKDATYLVQSILRSIGENLRTMGAEAAAEDNHENGTAAVGRTGALENYKKVAMALLGHAKAMYAASSIPISATGDSGGAAGGLHDMRFVAPFLSLFPTIELKQTYLRAFLYFVQVQLQFQRQQELHGGRDSPSAQDANFLLTRSELQDFMKAVTREVLVKHSLQFDDGVARGLSLVDFFVYLHCAPQESGRRWKTPFEGGAPADPVAAARAQGLPTRDQEEGILDASNPYQTSVFGGGVETMPPIGVITTREVVATCLELTRTFDSTTTVRLYGPDVVLKAVKKMVHSFPVPSQLMSTVLMAAMSFVHIRGNDFVRSVVRDVLTPLERASTWQTDPQLWRGVLLFAEKHYRDCSNFLINLPDQVLVQALRDHPVLMAHVREEHGNNASFGHILSNA